MGLVLDLIAQQSAGLPADPAVRAAWMAAAAALVAGVLSPAINLVAARWQLRAMLRQAQAVVDAAGRQADATIEAAARQVRASSVSANRLAWITTVRDTVAEFQTVNATLAGRVEGTVALTHEEELERSERANILGSRLEMLVNLMEDDHVPLLIVARRILHVSSTYDASKRETLQQLNEEFRDRARTLLMREWERVKRGE